EDGWGVVGSPDEMVGLADQFVERFGFTTLKVKGGVLPPLQEIDTMMLLRRRFGPDVALRLDPNAVWSVETSLRVAYELGRSGVWLEYLEDPTEGIAGMIHLAGVVPPMAAASDTHYPWLTKDILAGGPFRFDGGTLSVPAGPGLGVELDDEQVAEYHEAYQRGVVRRRDDTAEAIKR